MRRVDLNDEVEDGLSFKQEYPAWEKSEFRKMWQGYASKALGMFAGYSYLHH